MDLNLKQSRGFDLVVLNCGAGRQSASLVLMACEGLIPKPDLVVLSNTGWERKATLQYWEQILVPAMERAGIAYVLTSAKRQVTQKGKFPGMLRRSGLGIRDDVLRSVREGTPVGNACYWVDKGPGRKRGKLSRICTSEYKIEPITQAIRTHLGLRPRQRMKGRYNVEQWIGIATEESQRATGKTDEWSRLRYPLIEMGMSTLHCIGMIKALGYPVPPKSACIGCMYRSDASWAKMKRDEPEAFEDACDFDEKLRHPHGMGRLNDGLTEADYLAGGATRAHIKGAQFPAYLHPSLRPLREIDFSGVDPEGAENFGGEFC